MGLTRRELLKHLGALAALGSAPGLARSADRIIPWKNWSGAQMCLPAARVAPADEATLAELIRSARTTIRPVGSGHSFSALVPTDGTIISLGNFSGLIAHDPATLQAELWGGTPISQIGELLKEVGQGLVNMADIDYQTLAGAISTSTHGTGITFGSYSSCVTALRLVTARGDILDCDAHRNPEIFRAARVSLGALGVITRVRMQNRKAFRLHEKLAVRDLEDVLADVDRLKKGNEHFEFNALLHCDVALQQTQNETTDPVTRPKEGGGDGEKVGLLRAVNTHARNHPGLHGALLNFFARHMDFPDVVDDSYKVFANVRDQRFNEMEYTVPADAGPACLREIMKLIRQQNLNSYIPIEYRYVRADDIPLSMFGGRDGCAISVHQSYELDYHNFFAAIEPIFWKYEGRPHWGKLHTLNHAQFATLYPGWKDFLAIRRELDPAGKFLNGHLRSVFGV